MERRWRGGEEVEEERIRRPRKAEGKAPAEKPREERKAEAKVARRLRRK